MASSSIRAEAFDCPSFADVLVGSELPQGLEALSEVVGVEEGFELLSELRLGFVVIAPNGGFLEGAVHPLDLTIGPGMIRLGAAVLNTMLAADAVEHVQPVAGRRAGTPWGHIAELYTVVRQYNVDGVGHGFDQRLQEADR